VILCSRVLIVPLVLVCPMLIAQEGAPLVIRQGDLLPVRLQQQISSRTAFAGEAVKMEALADLVVDGRIVVRKGAPLTATITVAKKKAKMGPGGRIRLHIADVEMADGEHLALDTTQAESGGGPSEKVYKGLVIASIALLSPAGATTALLMHGQEVVLPEGTEFEARVAATRMLDQQKFQLAPAADGARVSVQSAAPPQAKQAATLLIETNAGEGSLWVDGKFGGKVPTRLCIQRGLHKVKVVRDGYKPWQQKVVIGGDPLTLLVTLEKR
jgi:PEGA domain